MKTSSGTDFLFFRDIIGNGQTFTIDTAETGDAERGDFSDLTDELDFMNFPEVENYLNPIEQTFEEQKMHMTEVFDGVWKKVLKAAPQNAKAIDFSRHRITYHRNFFMENDTAPFDSTYLNGKPDIVCNDIESKLPGFAEALSTMKEGESALFIISYKKMFGVNGCLPRVQPAADILAELKVLKVEEIGDDQSVNKINDLNEIKKFSDAKNLSKEARLRAKDYFDNGNIENAIRIYQKIQQMLEFAKPEGDDEFKERDELLIQVLSNLATCFNINDKPKKTLATIALIETKCDIDNQPKILFAKGKALRMLCEYQKALVPLKKAQKIRPNDKTITSELEKLDKCIADDNEFTKKLSSLWIKNI